jgi:hypothetical protein
MLRDDVQDLDDFSADANTDDADYAAPESPADRNKHLTQLRRRAEDILERKRLREALGDDADLDF